jgi:hypothetical protein
MKIAYHRRPLNPANQLQIDVLLWHQQLTHGIWLWWMMMMMMIQE